MTKNLAVIGALAAGIMLLLVAGSLGPILAQNATNNTAANTGTASNATQSGSTFTASGTINSLIFATETTTASSGNATAGNNTSSQGSANTTTAQTTTQPGDEPILPPVDEQPTPLLEGLEREQRGNVVPGDQPTQFEGQSLEPGSESAASLAVYENNTFDILVPDAPGTSQGNATQTAEDQQGNQSRKLTLTQIARVLPEQIYILGGTWSAQVADGNVTDVSIDFVMVHPGGSGEHTHNFTNIVSNRTVELDPGGNAAIIGMADIPINGADGWTDVPFVLEIESGRTATILVDVTATEGHFQGQPIYGIVEQLVDGSNSTAAG